jgi:hypothetical protein
MYVAFRLSAYMLCNVESRMIMNWKWIGKKRLRSVLRYYTSVCLEVLRNSAKLRDVCETLMMMMIIIIIIIIIMWIG